MSEVMTLPVGETRGGTVGDLTSDRKLPPSAWPSLEGPPADPMSDVRLVDLLSLLLCEDFAFCKNMFANGLGSTLWCFSFMFRSFLEILEIRRLIPLPIPGAMALRSGLRKL